MALITTMSYITQGTNQADQAVGMIQAASRSIGAVEVLSDLDLAAGPHRSRHMSYIHAEVYPYSVPLAVLCDSLRCRAYGTYYYGIS